MTREAKIGMLTGLGVIILIGVLLSKYLGDPAATFPGTTPSRASEATGRMADLPVGAPYRQQVLAPVTVPPMGMDGVQTPMPNGNAEFASATGGHSISVPPSAYAVEGSPRGETEDAAAPAGPSIRAPVSPQTIGPVPTLPPASGEPPLITLGDGVHPVVLPTIADHAMTSVTYTIAGGDTLSKIAKKFYNSSKTADLQRIVAANPGQLKDVNSLLVQGHKLVVPGVPVSGGATAAKGGVAGKPDPGMIPLPGNVKNTSALASDPARKIESPKKAATVTYLVQPGDTLQKIAKKLSPTKTAEMVQKIASLNGIKDPDSLQAGVKLKVPAPADTHLAAAEGK